MGLGTPGKGVTRPKPLNVPALRPFDPLCLLVRQARVDVAVDLEVDQIVRAFWFVAPESLRFRLGAGGSRRRLLLEVPVH